MTIIGGVHPSFMYEEVLENTFVDFVVREEGEETLRDLLETLENRGEPESVKGIAYREEGKTVVTALRPFISDPDSLPTAWDLIEWKDYSYFVIPKSRLGSVSSSRG